MTRIRYIEPVDSDLYHDARTQFLNSVVSPGTQVEVCNISLPPELAGPMLPPVPLYINEIIAEVLKAEKDGCDAAIIGCCSDPALPEAQRAVNIPVIGPLQAAAAVSASRGLRLGILAPDEHAWKTTANWLRANLRHYGMSDVVGPIRFVPMHTSDEEESLIGNTKLSCADVDEKFRERLINSAVPVALKLLEEDEAQAILFGCTLWGGMVDSISSNVPAVCLDPVITALRVAEMQSNL